MTILKKMIIQGDYLADKGKYSKVDDFHDPSNIVGDGMKEGDQVGADVVNECMKVCDDAGKICKDEVDWSVIPDVEFSKFTQPDIVKNDMTMKEVDNVVKSVTGNVLDDQVVDDVANNVKNNKAMEEFGNVVKGMTEAMDDVGTEKLQELGVSLNNGDELEDYVADEEKMRRKR
ncbi:hypothetical protein K7X08_000299 [Anisodus acutangulus]|uniref:Uncharacterized protein n=1 Tax=Anisodus acutangulus TaxID=402998 RepID=A0A9Q1RCX4_9SOLA|nr:hypothetical protein K7X08_000299 [Anisodus acutangulus]